MSLPYNQSRKRSYKSQKGKLCKTPGCDNVAKADGFCIRCYNHDKGNFKGHYESNLGKNCSNPSCDRPAYAKGLCVRCYYHKLKNCKRWNKDGFQSFES